MPTPINLFDCPGLIDLMLHGDERGPRFMLNGAQCTVEPIDGHACFQAATADFGLVVIYPGWYTGQHGVATYMIVVGEEHLCLQWLPIDPANKLALARRLPLKPTDRMIARLSI